MKTFGRVALFLSGALAVFAVFAAEPFPSTYQVPVYAPVLIQGATVLTGTGERLDNADVLISGRTHRGGRSWPDRAGRCAHHRCNGAVGDSGHHRHSLAPRRLREPRREWHLADGNEATNPVTANVWAEHSVWPQDPGFETALEGGVTTLQILPGSANLIGGRSVVLKNVHAVDLPGHEISRRRLWPEDGLRRESETRLRRRSQAPSTRMGNVAGYRQAFADAQDYQHSGTSITATSLNTTRRRQSKRMGRQEIQGQGRADKDPTAAESTEARSEARDAGRSDEGQHPRAYALLSLR